MMERFIPGLGRLRRYDGAAFGADIVAGAILSVLLVPQAMAYAILAGLPPQVGLYAALAPPLIYAFLGTSSTVSMGPVALASLLAADAIARSDLDPIIAAEVIAIETGALLLLLGIFRLGRLVNFVSDPALQGFTAAVAVLIAVSQIPSLLGIDVPRGATIIESVQAIAPGLSGTHVPTLLLGLGCLILLLLADRFGPALLWKAGLHPPWRSAAAKSAPLLVLIMASIAALWLPDVLTVEEPPSKLPPLGMPPFDPTAWMNLLPSSGIIAILIFVTGTAVAKSLAGRRRKSIDTSQEAIAIGAASIAAGMTGGYVPGVSLSRSALVHESGGRTPFASAYASVIVLLVILFLGKPLGMLPQAALAALVISAVFGLVQLRAMQASMRHSRAEGMVMLGTLAVTLFLGVQWGLAAGAGLGIAAHLWVSSLPRITRLGYQEKARHYRSVDRDEVEVNSLPVLVLRIDRSLYFGNVGRAEDLLLELAAENPDAKALLLDMKGVNDIDASGMAMLERLVENAKEQDLRVAFAVLKAPLHARFSNSRILKACCLYEDVEDAVDALQEALRRDSKADVDDVLANDRIADF